MSCWMYLRAVEGGSARQPGWGTAARCQEKPKAPALCQGARGAICCSCAGCGSPRRDPVPATQCLVPSLASLASLRAGAELNPWVTSALTAASKGPRRPLQQGNPPVPGKFVFITNKCPPAPLGWMGKWKEGNSGDKRVLTTLHPDQHVLSTNKGGQNTWGLLSSSSPSFLLEA